MIKGLGASPSGATDLSTRGYVDTLVSPLPAAGGRPVLLDTDFASTDVDDVVALRYLLTQDQNGVIDLQGVVVSASNPVIPAAVDAIAQWDGRFDLPIGQFQGTAVGTGTHAFLTNLAARRLRELPTANVVLLQNAVRVYRRILTKFATNTLRIVQIGFCTNLDALLKSPADDISSLTGAQLVNQAVEAVYVMGGNYPSGSEFNFNQAPAAAAYAVANCPRPMIFLGNEVGAGVTTGGSTYLNPSDPAQQALTDFGYGDGRASWDPMTAALACADTVAAAGYTSVAGTNSVNSSTGANTFTAGSGSHSYVVRAQDDNYYSDLINAAMLPPRIRRGGNRTRRYTPETDTTWTPDKARVPPMGWWKAAGLTLGALASWPSSGIQTMPLTQSTAGNRPTVVDATEGRRVRFSGSTWMDCATALLRTPDVTIFMVLKSTSSPAYSTFITCPTSLTTHTDPYSYMAMGRTGSNAFWQRYSTRAPESLAHTEWWNTTIMAELQSRHGSSEINGRSYNEAAGRQTIPYTNATAWRVGANGAGGEGLVGDVAEIIMFPSAMGENDVKGVRAYLRRTYGGLT